MRGIMDAPAVESVTVLAAPAPLRDAAVCAIWRHLPATAPARVPGQVPSNVYACLNLIGEGAVAVAGATPRALPACFVVGPMSGPLATVATPPLRSLSVVLQPWVLPAAFGLAPSAMVDALQDLSAAAAQQPALAQLRQALADATHRPDAIDAVWRHLQALLPPQRRVCADQALALPALMTGGVAAAAAALTIGERQYERRFGQLQGLAPRTWLRIKRFEAAMRDVAGAPAAGAGLAAVAAASGYADQAHLTRDFSVNAGEPPSRLRARLAADTPGYWAFRPARVGIVQDAGEGAA